MNAPLSAPDPGSLSSLLAQLPDEPTRRGRAFERLCKWFLENDSVYSARLRQVWLWNEWPGRWGADAGIDLVAEEHDGTVWAIQAKAYSPHVAIRKADIDSFLSESSRPGIGFRLLIASTDLLGERARKTLKDQTVKAGTLLLGDLGASSVRWPSSLDQLSPARRRPAQLRPHQRDACRDVVRGLRAGDLGQLVMACGTGKTLTALHVARQLKARRVLLLLPSLSLLSQVLKSWADNSPEPLSFIAVCSDESVAPEDSLDMAIASSGDLGIPVTTNPPEIREFLESADTGLKVVFSTYQSSPAVAEAQRIAHGPAFDLAVADEAHRLAGRAGTAFATVLRRGELLARKRLFMTATPRYATGRLTAAAKERDIEVVSMDDVAVFGPRLHTLTFGRAIELGLLSDYRVAVIAVDDERYRGWISEGVTVEGDRLTEMTAASLATHIGLAKAVRKFNLRRVITFHGRVASAKAFAESHAGVLHWLPAKLRPGGSFHADFVSGAMSAGKRRLKLDALRGSSHDWTLLTNARCLTEGIDVPALDGVAFIEPRSSEIDIVQAVGRALRLSPEKDVGTIIIPVFVGSRTDPEAVIEDSLFRPVWQVLNALRAHDEVLASEIDLLRRGLAKTRSSSKGYPWPSKVEVDLPEWVDARLAERIRAQAVERTSSSWEASFALLEEYVAEFGSARVPSGFLAGDFPLGAWVTTQRVRRAGLAPGRLKQLEALAGWTWDPHDDAWEQAFRLLESYAQSHGTARLRHDQVVEGSPIGRWCVTQRRNRESLSQERQKRLEALSGWVWDVHDSAWDRNLARLQEYAAATGTAQVPRGYRVDDVDLWTWSASQRAKRHSLSADRRERLEALPGWTWEPSEEKWDAMYELLCDFAKREGTSRVPRGRVINDLRLGQWVGRQRQHRDQLSEDRRTKLEALPDWSWNLLESNWATYIRALEGYVKEFGTARVPAGCVYGGVDLGRWVREIRYKRKSLTAARQRHLERLPGWVWSSKEADWEEAFASLSLFAHREGHCRVPVTWQEGQFKLGAWLAGQRQGRASMPTSRRRRLEQLPGWSWDAREDDWDRRFEALRRYLESSPVTAVTRSLIVEDMKIGEWVLGQRSRRARGQLTTEREQRLESLPGWAWNAHDEMWERGFSFLTAYARREGDAQVPQTHIEGDFALGTWVARQRRVQASLSAERRRRLESLPGWLWKVRGRP